MENEHTHTAILHFQFSIINYQLLIINHYPNAWQVGQGNLPLDHLHASEAVVGYEQVAVEVGKIDRGRELGSRHASRMPVHFISLMLMPV